MSSLNIGLEVTRSSQWHHGVVGASDWLILIAAWLRSRDVLQLSLHAFTTHARSSLVPRPASVLLGWSVSMYTIHGLYWRRSR